MAKIKSKDRQFFNSQISYLASSTHELRFANIAAIKVEDTDEDTAFHAFSATGDEKNKLRAIGKFKQVVEEICKSENPRVADNVLSQLFIAIYMKKCYAIEDTKAVSLAMSDLIADMFKAGTNLVNCGYERYDYGDKIVSWLEQSAADNYNFYHARSMRVPNKRAETLLARLVEIDPQLLQRSLLWNSKVRARVMSLVKPQAAAYTA